MQQTRLGLANRQLRQATTMRRVLGGMHACLRGARPVGRVQFSTTLTRASAVAEPVSTEPQPVAEPSVAQPPTPTKLLPGEADSTRFQQHWSVEVWRDLRPRAWFDEVASGDKPMPDRLRAFADTLTSAVGSSNAFASGESLAYWTYSLGRSGFFIMQAIAGLVAARAALGAQPEARSADGNILGGASPILGRLQEVLRTGWIGPLTEALLCYKQDLENIQEGKYKLPWDMTTPTHRQYNPLFVLSQGAAFLQEATAALRRRDGKGPEDLWLRSSFLPDYYQHSFHYQTDGWLSAQSARVYTSATETLFVGRQDSMQRSTLVPLSDFMKGKDASQLKVLEVACGTGRFATFLKDNYPKLDLTLMDLSDFYLAEARSNVRYWKSKRAANESMGGVDGTGATFLQAAAESIPAPDASYDVVYSIYMLHELPEDVRRKAIHEMARLVKPGGMVILTDSVQLGDRRALDASLGNFGDFNEPYYRNYLETDLGAIAEEAGLTCGMKVMSSTTKSLSFTKPLPQAAPATAPEAAAAEPAEAPKADPLLN